MNEKRKESGLRYCDLQDLGRMARRRRIEVEGGLYHVIARGNDRQDIFHVAEDRMKFISLLARQKEKAHFYLYAYCLMTNHFHLLVERRESTESQYRKPDPISTDKFPLDKLGGVLGEKSIDTYIEKNCKVK